MGGSHIDATKSTGRCGTDKVVHWYNSARTIRDYKCQLFVSVIWTNINQLDFLKGSLIKRQFKAQSITISHWLWHSKHHHAACWRKHARNTCWLWNEHFYCKFFLTILHFNYGFCFLRESEISANQKYKQRGFVLLEWLGFAQA